MGGIFLRWGVPGFVTVVGGTAISIMMTGENIASDLTARASDALANAEFSWASVSFDARDAVISGTATDQRMIEAVAARVASVHGVRAVTSNVVLAEFVSPFPFVARVDGGGITVSGGVPDETAHAQIVLRTAAANDALRLMSGAPPRVTWESAVDHALSYLEQFDEGEVKLADLDLSIAGRARSPAAFEALTALERAGAPAGVRVASLRIAPALASPFEWRASFDGTVVTMSGYTPTEELAQRLQSADLGGIPLSASLLLASGAPAEFDRNALLLLKNLVRLEQGIGTISDTSVSLVGAPADRATAEAVRLAMAPVGASVTLAPPRVAEYEFTAIRQGGVISLAGFVPDTATRDRLEALDKVDAAGLELARGAPERFDSAVDFALEVLGHMSEGSASIRGTIISLEGRAATIPDFTALETTLALGAPQGLILTRTQIKPPLADPFVWSATKASDGKIVIDGFVPSREVREALEAATPNLGADASTLADGNPADFERVAHAALGVLSLLDTGRIAFDGQDWSLSGAVGTPQQAFAAETAFAASGLRDSGWSYAVALPEPAAPAALPIIDPYVWRAQKSADGRITFSGFVMSGELKRFAAVHAGDVARDATEIASGAPAGFVTDVLAALDALAHLDMGTAKFENGGWVLDGVPPTQSDGEAAIAALRTATGAGRGWETSLSAPVVIAAPEPAAATETAIVPETAIAPEPAVASEPAAVATPQSEPASAPELEVATAPAPAIIPEPQPEPAPEPTVHHFTFEASKTLGAPVVLRGNVPADATRRWLGVIAGKVPIDALAVSGELPTDFIPNADAGVRALAMLSDGEFGLDGDKWVLNGRAASEAERLAALAALDVLPSTAGWAVDVTPLPPVEVCRQKVEAFATRNAILFQSGSARMTDASAPALDELAGYLAICPEATVHVEGHTDADGADDLNLVLSVARAEAVVNALIARGARAERLYAIGYGESLPIADNSTNTGKQANRRIVFTVLDDHL